MGRTLSWDDYLGRSQGPHVPCPAQLHGPLLVPVVCFSALGHYVRFVAHPLFPDVTLQKLISRYERRQRKVMDNAYEYQRH
jgi:hypothetical protein